MRVALVVFMQNPIPIPVITVIEWSAGDLGRLRKVDLS